MALASKKAATSKPTTRATGKRQKATQDEDSDEEVPKSVKKKKGDEEGGDGVKIDWKDLSLSWSLITAITDDVNTRRGLFPPPGGNAATSKGGGKPKTDYYWSVAQTIFQDHAIYGPSFASAVGAGLKLRNLWIQRVKNQLARMVKDVREFAEEMGQTGEGITCAEEIDMSIENQFTNKWAEIKGVCPWYWDLKAMISERPNKVPVGVGNNSSGYDTNLILSKAGDLSDSASEPVLEIDWPSTQGDDRGESVGNLSFVDAGDGPGGQSPSWEEFELQDLGNGEVGGDDIDESVIPAKRRTSTHPIEVDGGDGERDELTSGKKKQSGGKAAPDVKPTLDATPVAKRQKPRPGLSEPAKPQIKKGHEKLHQFTEVSVEQERTAQKALALKERKIQAEMDRVKIKVQASADTKMQRAKLKTEYELRRLELEAKERQEKRMFELEMARLQLQMQGGAGSGLRWAQTPAGSHIWNSASFSGISGASNSSTPQPLVEPGTGVVSGNIEDPMFNPSFTADEFALP